LALPPSDLSVCWFGSTSPASIAVVVLFLPFQRPFLHLPLSSSFSSMCCVGCCWLRFLFWDGGP
ncbi:hypothetical protein A2U01_0094752, partial [Trifolium medium]|nr:hypothetical protein [Trifolium medium]